MSPEKQMYQMSIRLEQLLGRINRELNALFFKANKTVAPHEFATNDLLRQTEGWKRELHLYGRQLTRIENLTAMQSDQLRGSRATFDPRRDRLSNRKKLLGKTEQLARNVQGQLMKLIHMLLIPDFPEAMAKAVEHLYDRVEQAQELSKIVEKAQRTGSISPAEGTQIKAVVAQYRPPTTPHTQGQSAGMDIAGLSVLAAMAYATLVMLIRGNK